MKSKLLEVEYSKTRFMLPKAEDWQSQDDTLPAFLRKSEDWSYEEELRMFARARGAARVIKDQGMPIYLFPFPKDCLAEVVFGIFTEEHIQGAIIELLRHSYPNVNVFQASLNETSFDLDIIPRAL